MLTLQWRDLQPNAAGLVPERKEVFRKHLELSFPNIHVRHVTMLAAV